MRAVVFNKQFTFIEVFLHRGPTQRHNNKLGGDTADNPIGQEDFRLACELTGWLVPLGHG